MKVHCVPHVTKMSAPRHKSNSQPCILLHLVLPQYPECNNAAEDTSTIKDIFVQHVCQYVIITLLQPHPKETILWDVLQNSH